MTHDPELEAKRLQLAKNALYAACRFNADDFEVDQFNRPALTAISHWLVDAPWAEVIQWDGMPEAVEFSLKPGAGLHLRGPVGTGKTAIMRAVSYARVKGGGSGFSIANAIRIVKEYNQSDGGGDGVILRYAAIPELCIDDLAREEDGNHYQKKTNVIADIINLRYEAGRMTHYTTNGDNEALKAKYDERTISRINEQASVLPIGGGDRRREATKQPPAKKDLFMPEPPMPTEEEMEAARKRRDEIKAQFPHIYAAAPTARTGQPISVGSRLRDAIGVPAEVVEQMLIGPSDFKLVLDKPVFPVLTISDDHNTFVMWASSLGNMTDTDLGLQRSRIYGAKLKDPMKYINALEQEIADRKAELEQTEQ